MKHFLNLSVFIPGSKKGWSRGLSVLSPLYLGQKVIEITQIVTSASLYAHILISTHINSNQQLNLHRPSRQETLSFHSKLPLAKLEMRENDPPKRSVFTDVIGLP